MLSNRDLVPAVPTTKFESKNSSFLPGRKIFPVSWNNSPQGLLLR